MYQRILVPVDGSATSQSALKEVAHFAKMGPDVVVRLIHVVDLLQASVEISEFTSNSKPIAALEDGIRKAGQEILDQALGSAVSMGFTPEIELLESYKSNTTDAILEHAKEWSADLIAMGTHGYGGLKHLLLGSVAEGIVRNTPVPVMLVRTQD